MLQCRELWLYSVLCREPSFSASGQLPTRFLRSLVRPKVSLLSFDVPQWSCEDVGCEWHYAGVRVKLEWLSSLGDSKFVSLSQLPAVVCLPSAEVPSCLQTPFDSPQPPQLLSTFVHHFCLVLVRSVLPYRPFPPTFSPFLLLSRGRPRVHT